jgi:hypothetical protein
MGIPSQSEVLTPQSRIPNALHSVFVRDGDQSRGKWREYVG